MEIEYRRLISYSFFVLIFCSLHLSLNGQTVVAQENLVLALDFDDEEWKDNSSNAHEVINHEATFIESIAEKGAYFSGQSAYLEIPNETSLEIPDQLTTSLWYKHETPENGSFYSLIEQSANEFDGHSRYGTWVFGGDQVMTCIEPDDCNGQGLLCQRCIIAEDRLEAGKWYHIVSSYDGQTLRVIINGQVSKERTYDFETGISVRQAPLTIGTDIYDVNQVFLKGTLDEVLLYDIALSMEQIQQLYAEFESALNYNGNAEPDGIITNVTEQQIRFQSIYPNPVRNSLFLTTNASLIEEIQIINLRGELIKTYTAKDQKTSIDLSFLLPGKYFLKTTQQAIPFVKE